MFQFNEKLTRNGYDVWGLADQFHAKPAEIKQLPSRERDVLRCKNSGVGKGNERRHCQVTRMSRNSLTEKSHRRTSLKATSLNDTE